MKYFTGLSYFVPDNLSQCGIMSLLKYLYLKDSVKRKILDIKNDIEEIIKYKSTEKFNVTWYGIYDIDPKHLVYWICVESDKLKNQLTDDVLLNNQLRMLLKKHDYPAEARQLYISGSNLRKRLKENQMATGIIILNK